MFSKSNKIVISGPTYNNPYPRELIEQATRILTDVFPPDWIMASNYFPTKLRVSYLSTPVDYGKDYLSFVRTVPRYDGNISSFSEACIRIIIMKYFREHKDYVMAADCSGNLGGDTAIDIARYFCLVRENQNIENRVIIYHLYVMHLTHNKALINKSDFSTASYIKQHLGLENLEITVIEHNDIRSRYLRYLDLGCLISLLLVPSCGIREEDRVYLYDTMMGISVYKAISIAKHIQPDLVLWSAVSRDERDLFAILKYIMSKNPYALCLLSYRQLRNMDQFNGSQFSELLKISLHMYRIIGIKAFAHLENLIDGALVGNLSSSSLHLELKSRTQSMLSSIKKDTIRRMLSLSVGEMEDDRVK